MTLLEKIMLDNLFEYFAGSIIGVGATQQGDISLKASQKGDIMTLEVKVGNLKTKRTVNIPERLKAMNEQLNSMTGDTTKEMLADFIGDKNGTHIN